MSKIITPEDVITIRISNVTGKASMQLSRDLPAPYVALVLSQLIAETMQNVMKQMNAPLAQQTPKSV